MNLKQHQKQINHVRNQLNGLGGIEDIDILQLIKKHGGAPQLVTEAQKVRCVPEIRAKVFKQKFLVKKDQGLLK